MHPLFGSSPGGGTNPRDLRIAGVFLVRWSVWAGRGCFRPFRMRAVGVRLAVMTGLGFPRLAEGVGRRAALGFALRRRIAVVAVGLLGHRLARRGRRRNGGRGRRRGGLGGLGECRQGGKRNSRRHGQK